MALNGYTKVCGKKPAGVYRIGLIDAKDITGATPGADGVFTYTALTLATGTFFKKYEFQEGLAEYQENGEGSGGAIAVTKNVIFKTADMDAASQEAVQEIIDASYCGMVAVVQKPNGEAFIVGYGEDFKADRPLRLSASAGTTGRALTDEKGDEVTLTCIHTEKSRMYAGDVDALFEAA